MAGDPVGFAIFSQEIPCRTLVIKENSFDAAQKMSWVIPFNLINFFSINHNCFDSILLPHEHFCCQLLQCVLTRKRSITVCPFPFLFFFSIQAVRRRVDAVCVPLQNSILKQKQQLGGQQPENLLNLVILKHDRFLLSSSLVGFSTTTCYLCRTEGQTETVATIEV